jgi:DNA (cytosine-5)-methyltransferase 1
MVPDFIRAVREARPRAFIMENVAGLLSLRNQDYIQWVLSEFRNMSYSIHIKTLQAADYGIAQNRLRVFFVGFRENYEYQFPQPTHGRGIRPYKTIREALHDVPEDLPNTAQVTYAKKPVLRPSPWAGMMVNGGGRPVNLDGLSHTITASSGGNRTHILDTEGVLIKYHSYLMNGGTPYSGVVSDVRRLTLSESSRLQSFADDYKFLGGRTSQYAQIGNAVPPQLAKVVGASVVDALMSRSILKRNNQPILLSEYFTQ